jgi:fatty acid synthase
VQDLDLLTLEDGAIVDRNAAIFCHVGIYRNGSFTIEQAHSIFGARSVIASRAATVSSYNLPVDGQLGVLELGFKLQMPTGLDMV